jgi:hypothetical protein
MVIAGEPTSPSTQLAPQAVERARDYVYTRGALWERALFAQCFEGGSRQRTLRCLAQYQNDDGGWAHAIEHDVRTPASNAVATEYALAVLIEFGLAERELVARTAAWCEAAQEESGEYALDAAFHAFPRAPWWREVTSWAPDAIAGRLAALEAAPPRLLERTARWATRHLSLDELRGLTLDNWRYRLYHYAEYVLNVPQPDAATWREALTTKVVELAEAQPDAECALGFGWSAPLPASALPAALRRRRLAALAAAQAGDCGWPDPHGLEQWRPIRTIWALKTLADQGASRSG